MMVETSATGNGVVTCNNTECFQSPIDLYVVLVVCTLITHWHCPGGIMEEEAVRYEVHGPSFASFRKGGLRIQSLLLDGIKLDQIERSYERFCDTGTG